MGGLLCIRQKTFEERIWNYTQGHWDNTTLFATYLDDELGTKRANQTHRIITPEIEA